MPIAFQGERGAFSEEAVRLLFGDVEVKPCLQFRTVFEEVAAERAECGVVPIENSQAGSITDNYDLLQAHSLFVVGEVELHVHHCLLALPGQRLEDIRRVHSHIQALMQCETYIRSHGFEAIAEYDTAGSAKDLAERQVRGEAAIASRAAAGIYGLSILAERIESNPYNFTRFLAIGRQKAARHDPSKTSIVFATSNEPGALHRAMGALASRRINITKVESRPDRKVPWQYDFYLDLEGHEEEPHVSAALNQLAVCTSSLRVLGSYPSAQSRKG